MWFCWIDGRFGWKPIQSEARVTRDAVSGLYDTYRKSAVWKTVPCIEYILVLLVLSSRQLSFYHFYNPETASRVTLASLGIGFQTNLMVIGCLWIKHQCLILWFCCGIKYQYKKTKKNIFVYFYLLIFYSSTIQPTTFFITD